MKTRLYTLLVCLLFSHSKGDLFTAISHLVQLAEIPKQLVAHFDEYLAKERGKDEEVRTVEKMRQQFRRMVEVREHLGAEAFVENPVNAYLLIKRLAVDWKLVQSLVKPISWFMLLTSWTNSVDRYCQRHWDSFWRMETETETDGMPSDDDLKGAATGLLRLQDTYNLKTSNLAKGIIPLQNQPQQDIASDPGTNLELTAKECFELANHSLANGNRYMADLWMSEAIDRVDGLPDEEAEECLLLLASFAHQVGHLRKALSLTQKLLQLNPSHVLGKGSETLFKQLIDASGEDMDMVLTKPLKSTEEEDYDRLCRGEKMLDPIEEAHLVCFFMNTRNKPFLRYVHIKVEEVLQKPSLLLFHQILNDHEMDTIKALSQPYLERSAAGMDSNGKYLISDVRISKTRWLFDIHDETVARISQRIGYITGLSISTAEALQVLNYGIGGYYTAHLDFTREDETKFDLDVLNGRRIATWINYMSDVKAGGATVFPKLRVGVRPQKGMAVFWWNLDEAGRGDLSTLHAGCPVLWGSKWISNKWFRERDQEFRRPCPRHLTLNPK